MGPIGVQEMIAIGLLALLLFGPKKLPELGRLLGKGLTEFRRAKNELRSTFETHMRELDREVRLTETETKQIGTPAPTYSPATYPYPYEDNAPYEAPVSQEPAEPQAALAPESTPPEHAPVSPSAPAPNGTVARTNGVRPLSSSSVAIDTEEEHPA
ncbi:MAG TPA: twin-arginine translocase TatA/TatE family subunit [Candidatus Dormibacteraeota bacterium]|nr:twin-arginine translocase TatA/TatE family subunit [Candidatus Dormibacteraeota bacterium]